MHLSRSGRSSAYLVEDIDPASVVSLRVRGIFSATHILVVLFGVSSTYFLDLARHLGEIEAAVLIRPYWLYFVFRGWGFRLCPIKAAVFTYADFLFCRV